jgi:hypothetical protein
MAVFKTKFKDTEIRCVDLPNANGTLIIAPQLEGERMSKFIKGKQVANQIVKSKAALSSIYTELVNEQILFRSLVGC